MIARTGEGASTGASQELGPQVRPVAGRLGSGRGGFIAIGVALLAVVAAVVVIWGPGGGTSLPAEATPLPGDELAEVDVVRADGPSELPEIDPGQLVAPVHAVTTACNINLRDFPPSSAYHVVTDAVPTAEGPTVCAAQPAPAALDDALFLGSTERVVGFVEDTGEALMTRGADGPDGSGASLIAMDLDNGDEREVLAPGAVGDPGLAILAAQARDGHLVVVTGGPSAIRADVLAGVDQRGREATRIWFGPVDGELMMVRQPTTGLDDGEMLLRDLHPPRIVDGADGPLVAGIALGGPTDDPDGSPTVLLLDLADGTWSRLPVEANIATFDRTDH